MDNTPTSQVTFSEEEWAEFRKQFSEMKHTVNNALAVFMALSELASRYPENLQKLSKTVVSRTPEIVAAMHEFTRTIDQKGVGNGSDRR